MSKEEIEKLCEEYQISNYTISNGVVDVDGDVNIYNKKLSKIPLIFGKVTGDFNCHNNILTSLVGSPHTVGGYFRTDYNQLTNLKGCPTYIGKDLLLNGNKNLENLEGLENTTIGGSLVVNFTRLSSLLGSPKKVGKNIDIRQSEVFNLDGFNTEFGGLFFSDFSPIYNVLGGGRDNEFIKWIIKTKVIQGKLVDLKRLKWVCSMFNKPVYEKRINKFYKIV